MITDEMIAYIDEQYWSFEAWSWNELYGDVLDYLEKLDEGLQLTTEETEAIVSCYEDLKESNQ